MISNAPFVFFNTLPKSGSAFLWEELAKSVNVPNVRITITSGTFPDDLIDLERLGEPQQNGGVAHSHIRPSHKNITMMKHFAVHKTVVHFRDPRQAILSWTHHVDTLKEENKDFMVSMIEPEIPDGYFSLPFEEKLDFQIEKMFPIFVDWIASWMRLNEKLIRVHFTSYEKFCEDPDEYLRGIIDFYGYQKFLTPDFKFPKPKVGVRHFRKGRRQEWRDVFSEKQRARVQDRLLNVDCDLLRNLGIYLGE